MISASQLKRGPKVSRHVAYNTNTCRVREFHLVNIFACATEQVRHPQTPLLLVHGLEELYAEQDVCVPGFAVHGAPRAMDSADEFSCRWRTGKAASGVFKLRETVRGVDEPM